MGQCVTWMLDILENKVRYLKPPEDLKRGKKYHQAFSSMFEHFPAAQGSANLYALKSIAYSAQKPSSGSAASGYIKSKIAGDHAGAERLMRDMSLAKGQNSFLLMIVSTPLSAHAIVFFREKSDMYFMYDPNEGVYKYSGGPLHLYYEIRNYMVRTLGPSYSGCQVNQALLLTTECDLKINSRLDSGC